MMFPVRKICKCGLEESTLESRDFYLTCFINEEDISAELKNEINIFLLKIELSVDMFSPNKMCSQNSWDDALTVLKAS